MDWTASGRKDEFSFEMVDPFSLSSTRGTLSGVVAGTGTLTWAYYTDSLSSGRIELDGANYEDGSLVRVYHTATLGSDEETREVGTFFVNRQDMTYRYGRWFGPMELKGMNARYVDDVLTYDRAVSAGSSAVGYFEMAVRSAGGEPLVNPSVVDATFNEPHVFEFGTSDLDRLAYVADFLGAQVGCDPHGRTTLTPYLPPASMPVSYHVPKGSQSVTNIGIVRSNDADEVINRYGMKFSKSGEDGFTLFSTADLPESHYASFEKTGRRKAETEVVSDLDPPDQATLDALCQRRLYESASANTTIQVSFASYLPFEIGDVVRVDYEDGGGSYSFDGLCQQIEAQLKPGMPRTAVFDVIRSY